MDSSGRGFVSGRSPGLELLLDRDAGFINESLLHFEHVTFGGSEHFFDEAFNSRVTKNIISIR